MKVKVWTDENNRLVNWSMMNDYNAAGKTDDGEEIVETDSMSNFIIGHSYLSNGQVLVDSDYTPEEAVVSLRTPSDLEITQAALVRKITELTLMNASMAKQLALLTIKVAKNSDN